MDSFRNLVRWSKYLLPKTLRKRSKRKGGYSTYKLVVQVTRIVLPPGGGPPRYYLRNLQTGRFIKKPCTARRLLAGVRLVDEWEPGMGHKPWVAPPEAARPTGERDFCVTRNCLGKQTRKSPLCLRCQRTGVSLPAGEATVTAHMPEEFVIKG